MMYDTVHTKFQQPLQKIATYKKIQSNWHTSVKEHAQA